MEAAFDRDVAAGMVWQGRLIAYSDHRQAGFIVN